MNKSVQPTDGACAQRSARIVLSSRTHASPTTTRAQARPTTATTSRAQHKPFQAIQAIQAIQATYVRIANTLHRYRAAMLTANQRAQRVRTYRHREARRARLVVCSPGRRDAPRRLSRVRRPRRVPAADGLRHAHAPAMDPKPMPAACARHDTRAAGGAAVPSKVRTALRITSATRPVRVNRARACVSAACNAPPLAHVVPTPAARTSAPPVLSLTVPPAPPRPIVHQ